MTVAKLAAATHVAHWVYAKLRESSWVEEPIDREPETDGEVDPAELSNLRIRIRKGKYGGMLVPYERALPAPPSPQVPRPFGPRPGDNRR